MKIKIHNSLIGKRSEDFVSWEYCLSNILISMPNTTTITGFFKIKKSIGFGFYLEKNSMSIVSGEIRIKTKGIIYWKNHKNNITTDLVN